MTGLDGDQFFFALGSHADDDQQTELLVFTEADFDVNAIGKDVDELVIDQLCLPVLEVLLPGPL